jgi:hypothetical protein
MVAIRVDGNIKVEYRSDLGKNAMGDMMVLDVTMDTGRKIRVVNLYDQLEKGRTSSLRPVRQVRWQDIMTEKTIVCGDFNSHSRRWDTNCREERDSKFWKDWQEEYMMQLGNNGQPTRNGSNGTQSVIDLTWSSPLESPLAQWRMGTESEETGSDHRLIIWETKHNPGHDPVPSGEQIRWDITRMTDEQKDEAELLWLQMGENRPILNDMSFCEEVESEAAWIQDTLTDILNQKARRIRICARSKRWWNADIDSKRKAVGRAKRKLREEGGAERLKSARKDLKSEIRKAKRKMWQDFLINAKQYDVWRALEFTKPAMSITIPTLSDQFGNTASSTEDKRSMLMQHAFPNPPDDGSNEFIFTGVGGYYKQIDQTLVTPIIWGQASNKAPGPDGIGAAAIKLLWKWDPERITALFRACIRVGVHPLNWKIARGAVIPKQG